MYRDAALASLVMAALDDRPKVKLRDLARGIGVSERRLRSALRSSGCTFVGLRRRAILQRAEQMLGGGDGEEYRLCVGLHEPVIVLSFLQCGNKRAARRFAPERSRWIAGTVSRGGCLAPGGADKECNNLWARSLRLPIPAENVNDLPVSSVEPACTGDRGISV